MKILATGLYFTIFFGGFLVASTYRFSTYISEHNHSFRVIALLIFLSCLGGFALAFALATLRLFPKTLWKKFVYGAVAGVTIYFSLFGLEDILSQKLLFDRFNEESFSDMNGHCGVYSGRSLSHSFFHWSRSVPHLLRDYAQSDQCRAEHFLEASKRLQVCKSSEDEVQCRVRFMNLFSQKGYWSVSERKMFLEEIKRIHLQDAGNKIPNSSWGEYWLKDQELNTARSSVLSQIGIEEQFNDEYIYLKQSEEYQELLVTQQVLAEVNQIVPKDVGNESPDFWQHFHEAVKQANFQIEKLSETEKDLQELRKKFKKDPAI